MRENNRSLYVEAQGWPCFADSPRYPVLFGPFNPNYKREVLAELKKNAPESVTFVSYISE